MFWFALIKENRLVNAECIKAIFNFFKAINFFTQKKYCWHLQGNINLPKRANELKYKIDFGICTVHLIAIAQE